MPNNEAKYFLIGAMLIFLTLFGLLVSGFMTPLILGLLLAGIAFPMYNWLRNFLHNRKDSAALLTILLIVLTIIVPLIFLSMLFYQEAMHLVVTIQEQSPDNLLLFKPLQSLAKTLNIDPKILETQFVNTIKSAGLGTLSQLNNLLSNAFDIFLKFFVMLVAIFYLLRDGKGLGEILIKASPLKTEDEMHIYHAFKKTGRAIFYGNFISALTQGTLGGIGFWLFGLESPILWGTIMALLSLIPLFGPYLIFLPAAAYLILQGEFNLTIGFLLYNLLIVSTIDNVIKPELIGGKMNVHPFLILISILGGLKLLGFTGLIYGPLIIVIASTLIDIYYKNNGKSTEN
ncbi:MAG: AI-2E family transporter [Candidatus Buchananbacteria bacterium]|nr:AI-2E family transporter [Candidatus Buchananbacteria bacterium]